MGIEYLMLAAWAALKVAREVTQEDTSEARLVLSILPQHGRDLMLREIAKRDPILADQLKQKARQ